MNPKGAHPIDVKVGTKVRHFRTLRGMSQEKLGEVVGVTFQQVQKYEKGSNRISASRLVQISHALKIDVRLFFDGIDPPVEADADAPMEQISRLAHQAGALMDKLPNQKVKASVVALLKAVAKHKDGSDDGEEAA
ncbi:helix-turn-helix transcriptional regulator [Rhizobium leguminosarum]|jgi:transcriptional regulator with XRE-family HTH domain|uniref:helix-turn-helix domain-containing protein n=1 Tax=Rhizobium leguminosarum TaxID=384 RepID=UPI002E13FD8E|nr:helix-turn-helix transcriptional regulator [Rhizobium leguminosarum]